MILASVCKVEINVFDFYIVNTLLSAPFYSGFEILDLHLFCFKGQGSR